MAVTGPLMRALADLIRVAAGTFDLESALVAAVVEQESGGFHNATRYEPRYRWLHDASFEEIKSTNRTASPARLELLLHLERVDQMTSWGLMQLMGANARVAAFHGELSMLLGPRLGLEYGCRFFAQQVTRCAKDPSEEIRKSLHAPLACYNAGYATSPAGLLYANEVLNRVARLKRDLFPES